MKDYNASLQSYEGALQVYKQQNKSSLVGND